MKILHIESGKHLYGGAKQVQLIIDGLQKKGVENHLICTQGAEITPAVKDSGAVVHPIHFPHELSLPVIGRIKKIIEQIKPDIVHLHSRRGADTLGAIAAKLTKTPCVLSRRVDNPEAKLAIKLKYPFYDKVICISQGIANVLLEQGVNKEIIKVVHSSINTEFYQSPKPIAEFHKEFDLEQGSFTIAVVAQLIKRKGHRYLLNILNDICAKHPQVQVLIFGKGPLKQELETLITEKNLNAHVKLAGFREDLHDWFGCFDLMVHPAEAEGLGVSLLQTGAAKTAIVASAVGGIPEIIIDKQTGWLIPPKDEQALYKAILEAIEQPEHRETLAKQLQKHVESQFSVPAMIEGNLNVYKDVLKNY